MSSIIKKLFGTLLEKPWEESQALIDNKHVGKTFGAFVYDCVSSRYLERASVHMRPLRWLVFSYKAIIENYIAAKIYHFAPLERLLRGNPTVHQTDLSLDFVVRDLIEGG